MSISVERKIFKKKNGFSLVELMAVLGIAGAGTLGFMHLQKSQMTGQKKVEAKYEATSIANSIGTLLLSKEACEQTFVGMDFSNAQNPQSFGVIRKKSASGIVDAYTSPLELGNIQITGFEYQLNGPLVGSLGNNRYGNFNVAIIYRSNSKLITNARSERIEVPYTIKLETDSSNRFVSCYSEISDIGSEVTRRACESIGGQFNNERCLLSPDIQNTQDDYRLLSYQNFKENIYQSFFRDNFVYRMEGGDTVEGNINMTNNASLTVEEVSGPMDVINKDFADNFLPQCNSSQVGLLTSNGISCQNLLCENANNGVPQYLAGFNANGTKICHPLVNETDYCPNSGRLRVVNGALTYECCTAQCNNAAEVCSNTVFPSSNSCGTCVGTKPSSDANWGAWVNTGRSRPRPGATCSAACGGGTIPTEVEQIRVCNNDQQCGGSTCVGNSQRWAAGPGQACNTETCAVAGKCTGSGHDTSLFVRYQADTEVRNGCKTQYRDQWFEINTAKFKRGNIYTITQGRTFSAEAGPNDTPTTVLNRLINLINSADNRNYRTLCNGSGSSVVTTASLVSANRMKYHINWQHSTVPSASRSCNGLDEAACGAATGCSWDTTSEYMCTGWNFTIPQGQCNGTYNRPSCMWSGGGNMGGGTTYGGGTSTNGYYQEPCIADPYGNCYGGGSGGSDPGCGYKYIDEQSCRSSAAVSDGCYWGNKQETCYASGPAQCSSLGGGCRWTSYPDLHRSCTSVNYQSGCTGVCTWGPR